MKKLRILDKTTNTILFSTALDFSKEIDDILDNKTSVPQQPENYHKEDKVQRFDDDLDRLNKDRML